MIPEGLVSHETSSSFFKKDLPAGYQIGKDISDWTRVIEPFRDLFPACFAARYSLILNAHRPLRVVLRSFLASVGQSQPMPILAPCDALFYVSNRKPNCQPMVDNLVTALVEDGFNVAFLSPSDIAIWSPSAQGVAKQGVPEYQPLLQKGKGPWSNLGYAIRSLLTASFLAVIFVIRRFYLFRKVFRNFLNVWYELFLSMRYLDVMNELVTQLKPRLCLTNGDHLSISAEMLLCPAEKGRRVCFFNEHPRRNCTPFISDEVWVWNEEVRRILSQYLSGNEGTRIEVIGRAEIDEAFRKPPRLREETDLLREIGDRRVLIYLSEFTGNPALDMEAISREALDWIVQVAEKCHRWFFLYKTRNPNGDRSIPGEPMIQGLTNVAVAPPIIPLKNFLHWDNTLAVAALSSTGLMVASALGKKALRLWVSRSTEPHPELDAVVQAVHYPKELERVLLELERLPRIEALPPELEQHFPYFEHTHDRMRKLCLRILGEEKCAHR